GAVVGKLAQAVSLMPLRQHLAPAANDPGHEQLLLPHIDGGVCDNSGVIALLARNVDRIICLSNDIVHMPPRSRRGEITPADIPTAVTARFGWPGSVQIFNVAGQAAANRVLDVRLPAGGDALLDLSAELSKRNQNGQPLVVRREYKTVANARYAFHGGRHVEI